MHHVRVTKSDLATLLVRELTALDLTQKQLAAEAKIPYPTLNAWINRTRGTSRVQPETIDELADALQRLGSRIDSATLHAAAGQPVPGPTDKDLEARLLTAYRTLASPGQLAVIQLTEAIVRESRSR